MLGAITHVYGWYFLSLVGKVQSTDVTEIAYTGMMLATVLALVALGVVSHILIAVASPDDGDESDERDKVINRLGEYAGGHLLGGFALVALGMAMFEVEHFWIANAILAGLVLSELLAGATKVYLYRRGV